jgi:SRSO17 transposase
MAGGTSDWKEELGRWLQPFLDRLGHKTRRQMCPLYVSGLIGPGDRKSIQPMARRLALGACDQLHHFIAAGVWDAGPLETELLVQADKLVGGGDAVLVIDDTAIPKKGTHSVGVAPQDASALGKTANCHPGVADACAGRTACDAGVAAVSSRGLGEQSSSAEASGRSSRISNGADEARDGYGRNRSGDRRRHTLWLRAGGCRLWAERAVPSGAHGS